MGRVMLFLLTISQLGFAGDYKVVEESFAPTLEIDQQIKGADIIFLGEIKKIEKVSDQPLGSYDEKVTYLVMERFKGASEKTITVYLCSSGCTNETVEMGNVMVGQKHVVFASGKEKLISSEYLGSFMALPEQRLSDVRPVGYVCSFRALQAYRNKKPMKDVIRISKKCK